MIKRLLLIFVCVFNFGYAQDISGLWVHDVAGIQPTNSTDVYAILFLNMDDSGYVTGYTYDYNVGNWCSFYLEGEYDFNKKRLVAANTERIKKAALHSRAKFKLFYEKNDNNEYLTGIARQKGVHGFMLSFGGALGVSLNYRRVAPGNYNTIEGYDKLKPYIDLDTAEVNNDDNKQQVAKQSDDIFTEFEEIRTIIREKEKRKNELINSHTIESQKITLKISDNNREDGDRISVFINKELILYNIEVSKTPKIIEVVLPKNQKMHELFLVANNVGEIPPNTSKIRYSVDGEFFEEVIFTNLRLNKYLKFITN